jgi:hypothetical protein
MLAGDCGVSVGEGIPSGVLCGVVVRVSLLFVLPAIVLASII